MWNPPNWPKTPIASQKNGILLAQNDCIVEFAEDAIVSITASLYASLQNLNIQ